MSSCPVCTCTRARVHESVFEACEACACVVQARPRDARRASLLAEQVIEAPDAERVASSHNFVAHLETFVRGHRLFDVGFGNAALLHAAAARSWQVAGVELAASAGAHARDLEHTTAIQDFLDVDLEDERGRYDVVSFVYSLEQFEAPDEALRRAYEMLREGGVVVVELVPLGELRARDAQRVRQELPTRVFFGEAEHVRELLWAQGFRIEEESAGIGWRWIARRVPRA